MYKPRKFRTVMKSGKSEHLPILAVFQIIVGVVVSIGTCFIGWKAHQLAVRSEEATVKLKEIEQQLAESKFGFERMRDIYDRTERYLSGTDQNEARGRVLVVLINSLPETNLRSELLKVVTEKASSDSVAAQAARLTVKINSTSVVAGRDITLRAPEKKGLISGVVAVNEENYTATVQSELKFVDSTGYIWTVPKGTVISSVSVIARAGWAIAGPPLSSDYTPATVLLEYHAAQRNERPSNIQRMFVEALESCGVSKTRVDWLKLAIKTSGFNWEW